MILVFLFTVICFQSADANIRREVTREPVIKSFQIENGDIIDCIDINKQIAFNHPLLKDHKIQMRPEVISKQMLAKSSINSTPSHVFLKTVNCPNLTVPIRRVSKEDQEIQKYRKYLTSNHSRSFHEFTDSPKKNYDAYIIYTGNNNGARGHINIWSPQNVSRDQVSSAQIIITAFAPNGTTNVIAAGWKVDPKLFGDQKVRLYTYWTADGGKTTGCFNTFCSGFVQVSSKIPLGAHLDTISTYGNTQYAFDLQIHQDPDSNNWWLVYENMPIGYWPQTIMPYTHDGGDYASWGGYVETPINQASVAMGSGHFPNEGFKKAAFINNIQVALDFQYTDPAQVQEVATHPNCYKVQYGKKIRRDWGAYIFYGGPSHCMQ